MTLAHIKRMSPYKPPLEGRSGGGFLLLDFNERTTPVAPYVTEALIDYLRQDCLQVYPEYGDFLKKLAQYLGVGEDEVMVTNGSDQGIDLIYRTVAGPGDEAVVPVPTFAMLTHSAEVVGLRLETPAYTRDFQYPVEKVLSLVTERTKVITVCNPNSPTGTLLDPAEVVRIAKAAPHASVLVDECYYEYSKATVVDYINECPNLYVTRTFSKTWGLPSLRLGYIVSSSRNIEELLKVRGPYDVNKLSVVAAAAALDDPSFMEEYVEEVLQVSRPMFLSFLEEKGITYWPTEANFVLIYPPDSKLLYEQLHQEGILVRPRSGPGIEGTVRITIGTKEDTERLIAALARLF